MRVCIRWTTCRSLLARADIVVVLLPLTPATTGLLDADLLGRMRPDALLVNAARGPIVDTDALLELLQAERVRAALDVTDPEPLPADHPLWDAPGVADHSALRRRHPSPRTGARSRSSVSRCVAMSAASRW